MSKIQPWVLYPSIWKTEAAFLAWIRGGIRRALWNRSPIKLEFMKANRIKIPNPNPKGRVPTVWGAKCALTGVLLPLSEMEVDHITGGHSLKTVEDIQAFVKGIVLISMDDLQFVSKEAHKAKSYAERMGISFEEAVIAKEVIKIMKQPVKLVLAYCEEHGYNSCTNATKRKAAVTEILRRKYGNE